MTLVAARIKRILLIGVALLLPLNCKAEESPLATSFIPPPNWELVDSSKLAPSVVISFLHPSKKEFPPSINLAKEKTTLSLSNYVKAVQKMYESDPSNRWRNLGNLQIKAGKGILTSIEKLTPFGNARIFQFFFLEKETVHILTAAALQKDFATHQKTFLECFASFSLEPTENIKTSKQNNPN